MQLHTTVYSMYVISHNSLFVVFNYTQQYIHCTQLHTTVYSLY